MCSIVKISKIERNNIWCVLIFLEVSPHTHTETHFPGQNQLSKMAVTHMRKTTMRAQLEWINNLFVYFYSFMVFAGGLGGKAIIIKCYPSQIESDTST